MRALIDIPEADLAALDALARRNKRSRAAEVWEAVKAHLAARQSTEWIDRGAGFWAHRDDIGDGLDYQKAARADRECD